jgi:hypothetical protein
MLKGATMDIKILRIGTQHLNGDPDASDVTNTYLVIDNGKEFRITYRTHSHGGNLGIAGQEGILYTDKDNNTVRKQVITVGKICGISIESDELVEGLSPWAIRGVVLADRSKETGDIRLIIEAPEGSCGEPVILIDGRQFCQETLSQS